MDEPAPAFSAGSNIAIKVPRYRWADTVAFYRDVLRLPYLGPYVGAAGESERFRFGALTLWIDCVAHQSQTDVWLEVRTADPDGAARWLSAHGTPLRDELEPLGDVAGHWISDPAGTVLLVSTRDEGERPA
jgi:hypothetical protein